MEAFLGHVHAVSGQREEAVKLARELSRRPGVSTYNLAVIYAGLADKEQALVWLERAYTERSSWLTLLKTDPRLDGLRPDPRFQDLMRRVGLVP
jgi:hypothetical protein